MYPTCHSPKQGLWFRRPENVKNLSDFRNADFAVDYGVSSLTARCSLIAARAVVVLDENDNVLVQRVGQGNR